MTTLIVDIETTGTDPDRHRIWELAAIVRGHHDPSMDGEWHWLIRPRLDTADPRALQIGRFYQRWPSWLDGEAHLAAWPKTAFNRQPDPLNTISRRVVASRFAMLADGATFVAANPAFDAAFLALFLRIHQQTPTWDYHLVDVGALAQGYAAAYAHVAGQPAPAVPWKTGDVAGRIGVPVAPADVRHTALGDARWAAKIYDTVMGHDAAA